MHPILSTSDDALVFAEVGKVYVAYLPHAGSVTLDLSAAKSPLTARWFDPRRGAFDEGFEAISGKKHKFIAPDDRDWALLVRLAADVP